MLGKIPEENHIKVENSLESSASVYSASTSSKMTNSGQARKRIPRNQAQGHRQSAGVSEIRQRVLSARNLRLKTMQNQLTLSHQHIYELEQENRSLKTTIRRQSVALEKYDSANAELPRLLNSHAEEIRSWQSKNKILHKQIRELSNSLKQRENALLIVTDQNKHFHQLNRDKHLEEREKLYDRVKELTTRLAERDNDIRLLARKHQLDTKMLRNQLSQEQSKGKDLQQKLDKANIEITRLNLLELNNGRNVLMRYRHLRETHSASTNLHYGGGDHHPHHHPQQHLKVSSCSSFYSKSPVCDSYRNEILYEDQVAEEDSPDPDFNEKFRKLEQQKKLQLQRTQPLNSVPVEENRPDEEVTTIPQDGKNHGQKPEIVDEEDFVKKNAYQCGKDNEEDLIDQFKALNQDDILQKESVLDEVCASLSKTYSLDSSSSNSSPKDTKKAKATLKTPSGSMDKGSSKKTPIDPKNKTKLLAALKAIDANESFDS